MKCDDAKGSWLDDLDAAGKAALEEHLASCADCRAAADRDRKVVTDLASTDPVEASETRRERAVMAMVAARGAVPRIARRRWIAAAVAAAVFAALATPMLLTRGGLSVQRLDGAAWLQRRGTSEFVALRLGDVVRSGDFVRTQSVVGLEGSAGLKVIVNRDSRVSFDDAGRTPVLMLAAGAVYVEAPKSALTVVDSSERRATLRDGRFEVRAPIVASPAGDKKTELRVQVEKGVALLSGAGATREVKDGQAATVRADGLIQDADPGLIAPWRKKP